MAAVVKISDLFLGDSVRNYSEAGLPTFGKFHAIVRTHMLTIFETEDGSWSIALQWGSVAGGDWTRDEAEEMARKRVAAKSSGWTDNRAEAVQAAIISAKARHNAKASESAAYAEKYGQIVS